MNLSEFKNEVASVCRLRGDIGGDTVEVVLGEAFRILAGCSASEASTILAQGLQPGTWQQSRAAGTTTTAPAR